MESKHRMVWGRVYRPYLYAQRHRDDEDQYFTEQCAVPSASPSDTLELIVPEYGSINEIILRMNLDGGIGEASFQPAGFSRPNSDCEGIPFTPPMNNQNTIDYIDNK